jgi:hypothetical protein
MNWKNMSCTVDCYIHRKRRELALFTSHGNRISNNLNYMKKRIHLKINFSSILEKFYEEASRKITT